MKFLFAYDHKFFLDKTDVLSKTAFPYTTWDRYLEHADELLVACRLFPLTESRNHYSVSSGRNVSFTNIPNPSSLAYFLPNNSAEKAMREAIQSVDAVIARVPSQIGFLAVRVARALNKPYAVEVVGDPKESYRLHGSLKAKCYAPFATKTMQKTVWNAPFALYITENELQKLYPSKGIQVACSNTELPDFSDELIIEERKSRDLTKKVVFGMIGSLDSHYKGLDVAIRALRRSKEHLPPFEFRVLGSGVSSKWMAIAEENGLKNEVVFCGTKPANEVFDWLAEIDIYLQPSRTEGQGRSVIEAMAMGCPVITSDVGGMKELTDSSMRFQSEDDARFSEIIQLVVQNKVAYKTQIDRNYAEAKRFSKSILMQKRNEHYQKFINWIEGYKK